MPLWLVHGVEQFGRFGLFLEGDKLGAVAYNCCLVTHLGLQDSRVIDVDLLLQKRKKKTQTQTHSSNLLLGKFCFSVFCEQLSNAKLSEIYVLEMQDQSNGLLVIAFVVSIRKPVLPLGLD